ncbi:MAG: FAD:protein FMN transferase [Candidatus Nitrosotenuis sp.]
MRVEKIIPVWGTEIYIDASSSKLDEAEINRAIAGVEAFFFDVDDELSTFKDTSSVTKLRQNKLKIEDAPLIVQEIWRGCLRARELSFGAFDPWAVEGGFDPSGFVKGWAAENAAEMLVAAGCDQVQVNAAGDIALRGDQPWKIGIVNPDNKSEIIQVFEVQNENIATSGHYEKGAHIKDPHTGIIAIGAKSGTVIGPDGGITDALATALMVDGKDAAQWIGNPELSEYTFWSINRHENTAWSWGPNLGISK